MKHKNFLVTPVVMAVASLFAVHAHAQNAATALNQTTTLNTVEVVSEGYRKDLQPNSPRNAYRTTASQGTQNQVLTREDIEQMRPRDVMDLLNGTTGAISTSGTPAVTHYMQLVNVPLMRRLQHIFSQRCAVI